MEESKYAAVCIIYQKYSNISVSARFHIASPSILSFLSWITARHKTILSFEWLCMSYTLNAFTPEAQLSMWLTPRHPSLKEVHGLIYPNICNDIKICCAQDVPE